jgi:hypothetical protein
VATTNPSSTCTGSGSAHGGWGRGSEGTTCALWAKHRTPTSGTQQLDTGRRLLLLGDPNQFKSRRLLC